MLLYSYKDLYFFFFSVIGINWTNFSSTINPKFSLHF